MLPYKAGDAAPPMVAFLQTEAGYTLSGKTVVLQLEQPDGTVVTRATTVLDAATRKVSTDWEATDFPDAGVYRFEYIVTSGGKDRTIPANGYGQILVSERL